MIQPQTLNQTSTIRLGLGVSPATISEFEHDCPACCQGSRQAVRESQTTYGSTYEFRADGTPGGLAGG
jgi:hypothetical protein